MAVTAPFSTSMQPHVACLPQPWSLDVENTVHTLADLAMPKPDDVAWCARMMSSKLLAWRNPWMAASPNTIVSPAHRSTRAARER
jgi:hypothetical protein